MSASARHFVAEHNVLPDNSYEQPRTTFGIGISQVHLGPSSAAWTAAWAAADTSAVTGAHLARAQTLWLTVRNPST